MIQPNDIVYVLSGGSTNTDPDKSLGGDPSATPILSGTNNLFTSVTQDESTTGNIDYRCQYVFNNSLSETLWNCNIYVKSQVEGGAFADLGVIFSDEIQLLTVIGNVTGGSLTLSYEGDNFTVAYNASLSVWVSNFQTAIRTVPYLGDVIVTGQTSLTVDNIPVTTFTILYTGSAAGNRFHPILTVITNALTPLPVVSASRLTAGGPINSIAPVIDRGTTTPTGVVFADTTQASPLRLGDLRPTDGFPVWVRRTTQPDTQPLAGDGFTCVCSGTAFP